MAVAEDFRETRISNRLIVSGLIWGLAYRMMAEGFPGVVHFLMNICIPVILLFLIYQLRVLGAGDIKLFSVASGFLTVRQTLCLILAAFLTAALIGAGKLIYRTGTAGYQWKEKTKIHFSIFIFLGYLIVVWGCAIE